jgi:hypothetical protein
MNVRHLVVFLSVWVLSGSLLAGDDPFVGTWKLNADKSKLTGFQEKIEDLGDNKYRFTIGHNVETIAVDGEDHPTNYGTWALKKEGPNTWKSVDKIDGKVISTATWTISDDGQTFTAVTQGVKNDGSTYESQFTAKRIDGTSGLVGTWGSADTKRRAPAGWVIKPYEADGLSFISPTDREEIDLKFDEKEYPDKGAQVAPHSTMSARRVDERNIEMFGKVDGKLVYSELWKVSDDGTMLAIGVRLTGDTISETDIYERQ